MCKKLAQVVRAEIKDGSYIVQRQPLGQMIADVLLHLADDLRAVIQLGVGAFMVEGHRLALMQQRQRGKGVVLALADL